MIAALASSKHRPLNCTSSPLWFRTVILRYFLSSDFTSPLASIVIWLVLVQSGLKVDKACVASNDSVYADQSAAKPELCYVSPQAPSRVPHGTRPLSSNRFEVTACLVLTRAEVSNHMPLCIADCSNALLPLLRRDCVLHCCMP